MATLRIFSVGAAIFASCHCAPTAVSAENPVVPPGSCLERLVIPQYPVAARSAGISASVKVLLRWADAGKVVWRIESAKPHFDSAVEEALKISQFSRICTDSPAEITFDFMLTGVRQRNFRQQVVFLPPSRFQILTDLMEVNP